LLLAIDCLGSGFAAVSQEYNFGEEKLCQARGVSRSLVTQGLFSVDYAGAVSGNRAGEGGEENDCGDRCEKDVEVMGLFRGVQL
jgi:hypothetical protein